MSKKLVNTKDVVTVWSDLNANVSATARQMNISRRTVYEHLARAGYFEWRHSVPGCIQFKRRLPTKIKTNLKDDEWKMEQAEA